MKIKHLWLLEGGSIVYVEPYEDLGYLVDYSQYYIGECSLDHPRLWPEKFELISAAGFLALVGDGWVGRFEATKIES